MLRGTHLFTGSFQRLQNPLSLECRRKNSRIPINTILPAKRKPSPTNLWYVLGSSSEILNLLPRCSTPVPPCRFITHLHRNSHNAAQVKRNRVTCRHIAVANSFLVRRCEIHGSGRLGQLLVKCQTCGARYPSGIVTDLEIIQKDPKSLMEIRTICPFCRNENLGRPRSMTFTSAQI